MASASEGCEGDGQCATDQGGNSVARFRWVDVGDSRWLAALAVLFSSRNCHPSEPSKQTQCSESGTKGDDGRVVRSCCPALSILPTPALHLLPSHSLVTTTATC
jgi:hypothetical protein